LIVRPVGRTLDDMTAEPSRPAYRITIEALEAQSRVPPEEQLEAQVLYQYVEGPTAWDQELRQRLLAGGA
jgi:hypothetical protein